MSRGGLPTPVRGPGEELWAIGAQAVARWRAAGRPVIGVAAGALCVVGYLSYRMTHLRHLAIEFGAVTAGLPLHTELARLPGSAFLPTAELPLPAALIQVVGVLGLAELVLGRWSTAAVALLGQVGSTLLARLLITLGSTAVIGLPAAQAVVLDTGPSAMTASVGAWMLTRCRAYWCLGMLGGGLVLAGLLQDNLDGREHLAAFACGGLAALAPASLRALSLRAAVTVRTARAGARRRAGASALLVRHR